MTYFLLSFHTFCLLMFTFHRQFLFPSSKLQQFSSNYTFSLLGLTQSILFGISCFLLKRDIPSLLRAAFTSLLSWHDQATLKFSSRLAQSHPLLLLLPAWFAISHNVESFFLFSSKFSKNAHLLIAIEEILFDIRWFILDTIWH